MSRIFTILSLLLLSVCGYAQNPDAFKEYGDDAYSDRDYYGASHYYAKALKLDSERLDIHWAMAESYRKYHDYTKALAAYKSLSRSDREEEYPQALFYYALMLKHNEQYLEAADLFEQYQKVYRYEDAFLTKKAAREAESCLWAAEHSHDSTNQEIKLLPKPINSFDAELAPWLTDDSVFYFSSLRYDSAQDKKKQKQKRDHYTRNFKAERDSTGKYVLQAPPEINIEGKHMGGYFKDENLGMAFLTVCTPLCKIYISEKNEGSDEWTDYTEIDAVNQSGYNTSQPHAVKSGGDVYLFFTSDRARGAGKNDIWYSVQRRSRFSRPRNLRSVNTKGNEVTPWYDTARKALYFSSDWHNGFGGYDVFKAQGEPGKLSDPENLLKPVNSPANDLYYKTNNKHFIAHFVSNRKGGFALKGESCCNNIYSVTLDSVPDEPLLADIPDTAETVDTVPEEKPELPPVISFSFDPVTLYFPNDYPDPRSLKRSTESTYESVFNQYQELIDEYSSESDGFPSFFESKAQYGPQALSDLTEKLEEQLEKTEKIFVFLLGYASTAASSDYNLRLTERRINSVQNSLLQSEPLRAAHEEKRMVFVEMPLSEFEAGLEGVSDDRGDLKASVYSAKAAENRKVRIEKILMQTTEEPAAVPVADRYTANVSRTAGSVSFQIKNIGDAPLEFSDIKLPEGFSVSEPLHEIEPKDEVQLKLNIAAPSKNINKITLNTQNGVKLVLFVRLR